MKNHSHKHHHHKKKSPGYTHPKSVHLHPKKLSKHRHPKVVYRRKKRLGIFEPKSIDSRYRWIEDLHNVHKEEEIWILGSGPSLDDFPDGFFDEFDEDGKQKRIAIATKWSMIAFPNCAYSSFSRSDKSITQYVLANRQHLLHKHIVNLRASGHGRLFIGSESIYMRVRGRVSRPYYEQLPKIVLSGKPYRYGATNTLVHWAIQAAIIMGAKKVTLAGCESRARKFQKHALKRGMDQVYGPRGWILSREARENAPAQGYPKVWQTGEARWYQLQSNGVKWLAKYFAPYGIQITRHYYGKGYEKII